MGIFEVGKTYKLMMNKGFSENSIYTLRIENEDNIFVSGIDLKGQRRGVKKEHIIDWIEMN